MIELQNHEPFGQGMIDLEVAEHTQLEPVAIFPEDHEDPWRIFFCFFFQKNMTLSWWNLLLCIQHFLIKNIIKLNLTCWQLV